MTDSLGRCLLENRVGSRKLFFRSIELFDRSFKCDRALRLRDVNNHYRREDAEYYSRS